MKIYYPLYLHAHYLHVKNEKNATYALTYMHVTQYLQNTLRNLQMI